ncbi:MAG: beta-lactamase family protein [Rhodothermales bacterium]|nr:beta-lactamase family protein [Rhodothermales bacterium]
MRVRRLQPLTILLWAFLVAPSYAQTASNAPGEALQEATPASAGMSPDRLQRIDAMLAEAVDEMHIPGAVALVARHGKIVYWKAHGTADAPAGRMLERDAIFRIASQTKAVTSTAVMMLWEEGHFQLDDPVSRYIPAFADPQVLDTFNEADSSYTGVPAAREITIRHLLTHTSGLGYGVIDGDERFRKMYAKAGVTDLFTTEPISIEESVLKLAALPLHHNPGEGFTYSEGLDVLGYFVEVISGMPFDEFLRVRLFEPLGMSDTAFYLPANQADRLVAVQQKGDSGEWERWPVTFYDPDYPITGARRFFSGGAGLSSTALDYATFLQMYLNGGVLGGVRILSRTTIDFMMKNQIGDQWGGNHYGLAFGLLNDSQHSQGGRGSIGTFDWGGYFNTQYFADPAEGVVGILMKQTQGPIRDDTSWKFRLLVGAAIDD